MLEQILQACNNWFLIPGGIHLGEYTVEDGGLALPFLQDGQYFRVVGSVFNDGLHQYPATDLTNESFEGAVWALAVPKAVISLSEEVTAWETKNGAQTVGQFQSESFPTYSYTRATGKNGGAITWEDVFGSRLNRWRKL